MVDNFTVYFFLGPLESDVVGSITTFKRSTEECANCKQHQADFMYGVVGFTDKLSRKLPDVKLDDKPRVEAWLMKNFHWKIILVSNPHSNLRYPSSANLINRKRIKP